MFCRDSFVHLIRTLDTQQVQISEVRIKIIQQLVIQEILIVFTLFSNLQKIRTYVFINSSLKIGPLLSGPISNLSNTILIDHHPLSGGCIIYPFSNPVVIINHNIYSEPLSFGQGSAFRKFPIVYYIGFLIDKTFENSRATRFALTEQ